MSRARRRRSRWTAASDPTTSSRCANTARTSSLRARPCSTAAIRKDAPAPSRRSWSGRGGGDGVSDGDVVQLRVRYPEVDRMGVAHHANHFIWFEIGRTESMRARGVTYRHLEDEGIFLPVIEASCTYHAPARYDDLLRVRTRIEGATAVRIAFEYRLESEEDGRLLATGATRHASVDRNGRPRRLPARLRELLA